MVSSVSNARSGSEPPGIREGAAVWGPPLWPGRHQSRLFTSGVTSAEVLRVHVWTSPPCVPDPGCSLCPAGWLWWRDRCYFFSEGLSEELGWKESAEFCRRHNSSLVVIEDPAEMVTECGGKACAYMQHCAPNTDSSSGFSPVCEEEVLQSTLPMGGVDGHQGGGPVGVDGRVWPPALHAVSTSKFFPALIPPLCAAKSH